MSRSQNASRMSLRAEPELDIHQLVTVYTVADPVQAEIIQNALHAEGIRCFLDGENQAGETGVAALEIKIQVPIADADRAGKFIEAHEHRHKS
ncbi:MAG: DUF2007 domain-containing protein [Gemmataceae bacterium]|nr:DUF2007 domain-containing protein [Gemmataceae bacterium]